MKGQKIIIKKVKKGGHGGHHGGSWKVAYADFVTAMMAFFLLLWLITMVAPEKRARVASYFKSFTIFDKAGSSMMLDQPGGLTGIPGGKFSQLEQKMGKGSSDVPTLHEIKERLKHEVEAKLADVKDQVMVDIVEGNVRIELVDKDGSTMFPLGGAELTSEAKKILRVIADNIADSSRKIIIEGHTDALSYSSSRYTNWELSTDRASAARKELENNGLNPDRLLRVAGYAATVPLIKEDPNDPRNRRISIIMVGSGTGNPSHEPKTELQPSPGTAPVFGKQG